MKRKLKTGQKEHRQKAEIISSRIKRGELQEMITAPSIRFGGTLTLSITVLAVIGNYNFDCLCMFLIE